MLNRGKAQELFPSATAGRRGEPLKEKMAEKFDGIVSSGKILQINR
jgi:hypothetical protein